MVRTSNWNANHTLHMTGPALVGRQADTQGAAEEITIGSGLSLFGGVLSATGGATNLGAATNTTTVTVTSDTGADATISAATGSAAGVMTAADKTKLDGVASGATANATNAELRDRSTHTGTQAISTVTGLQDALDAKADGAATASALFDKADAAATTSALASKADASATTAALALKADKTQLSHVKVPQITGAILGLPRNGSTIAADGTLTLSETLPFTFSGGPMGVWMYFPAGAVVSGAAGLYWTVMTSGTAGTVYTNYYNPATATAWPAAEPGGPLTAAVGSGAAFTTPVTNITAARCTLPAGTLTPGDVIRWSLTAIGTGAGTKSYTARIGGTQLGSSAPFHSTVVGIETDIVLRAVSNGALSAVVWSTHTAHNVNLAADQILSMDFRGSAGNENILMWCRASLEAAL